MRVLVGLAATVAIVVGLSGPMSASAQTEDGTAAATEDWTLARRDDTIATYVRFDSGIDIVVRCESGTLETLIVGLPPAATRTRQLRLSFGDERVGALTWYVGADPTVAVGIFPARFARSLRAGGSVNMVVPGGASGGRNLRYILDLPASSAAIDETLSACGKPSIDPRDEEVEDLGEGALPSGWSWARPPQVIYPERIRTYTWGFATISCLSQPDGALSSCEVDAQHPIDGGFGAAALRGMRLARVQQTDQAGQPMPRRLVSFTTRFEIEGMNMTPQAPTGSRITLD